MSLNAGSFAAQSDWEQKAQATVAMPAEKMQLMTASQGGEANSPQPNLVVTMTSGAKSEDEALDVLLASLGKAIPEVERGEREDVSFDDGGKGRACLVTFAAGAARIAQLHAVRLAGERIAHIVATAPAERDKDMTKLREVLKTYQPPSA